jgi:hypothetical protein
MPELRLHKAQLWELESDFKTPMPDGKRVTVQFNPETLKVSFANQITQEGAGSQKGTEALQFVGKGTTKLALQLWFDVTAPMLPETKPRRKNEATGVTEVTEVTDVRKLTEEVIYFITPQGKPEKRVPPAVLFLWGSFFFAGIMDSLEESLEFFSNEGKPLRASISISLLQQDIAKFDKSKLGLPPDESVGTQPLTEAPAGSTLPGLASSQGKGDNWQGIAEANGIENPRLLQPGQLIDMNAFNPQIPRR